jgi:serine O-acetyltransferase
VDRPGTAPLTFAETRRRLRADRARLVECLRARGAPTGVTGSPAWIAVRMHRGSRYLYACGWPVLARIAWQANLWLTGADISPSSELGEGLVIVHPFGVTVTGSAGRNLTIEGLGGMGGGMSLEDIGAGPGVPVLGDDVYIDRNAMVLGPVRVGDGARIGPGCTIVRDLAAGSVVTLPPARVRHDEGARG